MTNLQVENVITDWEKWSDGRRWGRSLSDTIAKYIEYRNWQEKTKPTPPVDEFDKDGGGYTNCPWCNKIFSFTELKKHDCSKAHYGKPATAHLTEQEIAEMAKPAPTPPALDVEGMVREHIRWRQAGYAGDCRTEDEMVVRFLSYLAQKDKP